MILDKPLNMHLDGLVHVFLNFFPCRTGSYAAGQIGRKGGIISIGFFYDYEEAMHSLLFSFQLCLFQDTVERPRSQIVIRMTGNGHPAWLDWMLVLPVTAARYDQKPAILLDQRDNVAYFHEGILAS